MSKMKFLLLIILCTMLAQPTYAATKLSKPKKLEATATTEHSITLTWKAVDKAKGYIIHWKNMETGKTATIRMLYPEPKFTVKHLKMHTTYKIYIQAIRGNKTGPKSKTIYAKTLFLAPEKPEPEIKIINDNKIKIKWKACKKATEYEIRIRQNKKLIKRLITKKTSYTFQDFDCDKTYKIAIRSIRTTSKKKAQSAFSQTYVTTNDTQKMKILINDILTGNPYEEQGVPNKTYTTEQMEAFANVGNNGKPFTSNGRYLLWCNRITYHMTVFTWLNNKWKLVYYWPCIIGINSSPTRAGTYTLSRLFETHQYGNNYAKYGTSYDGDNAIHSLLYPSQSDDLETGYKASYGCIRLVLWQAQFIYEDCIGCTLIIR